KTHTDFGPENRAIRPFIRKRPASYYFTRSLPLLILLAIPLTGGCRKDNDSSGLKGRALRFLETPPLTFNPRKGLDATSQRLGALFYFGLTRLDRELRVAPGLAESWSHSPDGLRWTFRLRKGLRDH